MSVVKVRKPLGQEAPGSAVSRETTLIRIVGPRDEKGERGRAIVEVLDVAAFQSSIC